MTDGKGYGACPKCGENVARGVYGTTWRERGIDGNTHCGACGYTGKSRGWPKLIEQVGK